MRRCEHEARLAKPSCLHKVGPEGRPSSPIPAMSPLARSNQRPSGRQRRRGGVVGHNVGTFCFSALEADVAAQARASAGDRAVAAHGGLASLMPSPRDNRRIIDARGRYPQLRGASVSESDGGTRLSFPSTDPGREVISTERQVVGFRHGRASLPARRLRGPCPCRALVFTRAPPPCSSRPSLPFSRQCGARISSFMAYLSSLTGMRRLAVAPSTNGWAGASRVAHAYGLWQR